jgi:pilus assembly protein CpaB
MPAKAILTLLFLIALCVVVVLGFRALPHRLNSPTAAADAEILVAATALRAGTLLRPKDVGWHPIVGTARPGHILRAATGRNPEPETDQQAPAGLYGAALRDAVNAGEPISRGTIVKPGDREFLQVVLAPRARAIAIPVTTGGASTGLLSPGDRVDVILTQTFKNDALLAHRSVGEAVVANLRVLAIDPLDAKPSAPGNGFGRTVTLEVTPEQAEEVNVASELGKLSLILRSIDVNDGVAATTAGLTEVARVKPIWAGDVSPALGQVMTLNRNVAAAPPGVEVLRGTKIATVKSQ